MRKIIVLNKKEGETPLEALGRFRRKYQSYKNVKMTYAGRLDPMASGLLLVLAGEEVKNKEKYLLLDKEYAFQILFGFATDSHDVLGKITDTQDVHASLKELKGEVKKMLKNFLGKSMQKYPLYSSKTVKGKPLFTYGRSGKKVKIPAREILIKKLELTDIETISEKKLLENIKKRISKVSGDFRQKEILKTWEERLLIYTKSKKSFPIVTFKIKCSSGTYIRGIADLLGKKLKIPALAFSIKRTRVGKYMI